jgi:quinol monooxygenase YgiN
LLDGLTEIEKNEPGTLSILLIEDENDENVVYVMERFGDQKGLEGHMNGEAGKKALPVVKELMESREGGFFKEVAGFVSKDE